MCELLALWSSQPARLTFSLHTLAARGDLLGRSHDGWGVAFYEGFDVALYREPRPAADSALVHLLETQGLATGLAISISCPRHQSMRTPRQVSLLSSLQPACHRSKSNGFFVPAVAYQGVTSRQVTANEADNV